MEEVFKNKILVLDEVISHTECEILIDYYNHKGPSHRWNDNFPMSIKQHDYEILPLINKIVQKVQNALGANILYDWGEIVMWPENSAMPPHYDVASDKTVFTSITYLNDDYEGGNTFIVNDVEFPPKRGRTVCFDGKNYLHGVSIIKRGLRYSVPIWYKI